MRRFLAKHQSLKRALWYWARVGVCANSLFLALYVLLPMAICGGVTHLEDNRVLRWVELAFCLFLTALGIGEAVLSIRKERNELQASLGDRDGDRVHITGGLSQVREDKDVLKQAGVQEGEQPEQLGGAELAGREEAGRGEFITEGSKDTDVGSRNRR